MSSLHDYSTTFTVDRTSQDVFDAINNVTAWWSQEVVGPTDRVGGEFAYHFQDVHRCTLYIAELVPSRKIVWHVTDNFFNFVQDQDEWNDTDIIFEINATTDETEVRFTHAGLSPRFECYDVCSNAWSGYINGSLRSLILNGKGQPNPKEGGTPAHQNAANNQRERHASTAVGETS